MLSDRLPRLGGLALAEHNLYCVEGHALLEACWRGRAACYICRETQAKLKTSEPFVSRAAILPEQTKLALTPLAKLFVLTEGGQRC